MFKLIGKEINATLGAQTLLIWTYVSIWVKKLNNMEVSTGMYEFV